MGVANAIDDLIDAAKLLSAYKDIHLYLSVQERKTVFGSKGIRSRLGEYYVY